MNGPLWFCGNCHRSAVFDRPLSEKPQYALEDLISETLAKSLLCYYGPVLKAFAAIEPEARDALEADIYALLDAFNVARDGTLVLPSEYLEVVITKR